MEINTVKSSKIITYNEAHGGSKDLYNTSARFYTLKKQSVLITHVYTQYLAQCLTNLNAQ